MRHVRLGMTLAALIAALAMGGCVALGGIDRTAMTIDKSVGAARNQSILLNVVRASEAEPLYFYSINEVQGNGLNDFKFSLPPFTLGPRQSVPQQNYTFGATNLGEMQTSGFFQVAVLDSKNFYAGMLAPFDLTEVSLLLRQGFPRELVYRLATQDITVYMATPLQPKGALARYVNDPNSPTYPTFEIFLEAAMSHGITVEEYTVRNAPPKGDTPTGRLCSDLALVTEAGAQKDVQDSGNACGARPVTEAAEVTGATGTQDLEKTWQDCVQAKAQKDAAKAGGQAPAAPNSSSTSEEQRNRVCSELGGQVVAVQLNTRSAYGVLLFLGELLKTGKQVDLKGLGAPSEPKITGKLMTITKDQDVGCFVKVDWRGRYCLPSADSEPLKETFSIINAMQGLKTSPGDLPITPTVRVAQ